MGIDKIDKNAHDYVPYPLPPWEREYQNLSVFCEVDESIPRPLIPDPLELLSDVVQIAVMYFDSSVPTRPYYDAACIASVRYKDVLGGYWFYSYNSTDQATAGTREIWGYNMKLADMDLNERADMIEGETRRMGKTIMSLRMTPSGRDFSVPVMFPRKFLKFIPDEESAGGVDTRGVVMDTKPGVTVHKTGEGSVEFEPSDQDPLHAPAPKSIIGESYTTGHQILPWGRDIT